MNEVIGIALGIIGGALVIAILRVIMNAIILWIVYRKR